MSHQEAKKKKQLEGKKERAKAARDDAREERRVAREEVIPEKPKAPDSDETAIEVSLPTKLPPGRNLAGLLKAALAARQPGKPGQTV